MSHENAAAARLTQLHDWHRTAITEAFNTAYAVEQGAAMTPEWQALLTRYEVPPLSDEERHQVQTAQRPLRGAAVMEFLSVVQIIVKNTRIAVKQVKVFNEPDAVEKQHERLLRLLERTERELVNAYKGAVLPKAQGMFANVFHGHDPQAAARYKSAGARTLTCRGCGAPRLSEKDFDCAYCGQKLI